MRHELGQHRDPPSPLFGVVTVVLTLIGWSSIPLFLRHFAEQIDPWTSNGWRYGFSAVIWLPLVLMAIHKRRVSKAVFLAAIVPSIVNVIGQVCFTIAHYRIDPGLLTFGLRSQLLFVAIGAWIMFPKEREVIRTPGYILGAIMLVIGMVGVVLLDQTALEAAKDGAGGSAGMEIASTGASWGTLHSYVVGIALALGAGAFFAAYGLAVRKFMHGVNSVLAFAVICQYTAAAMIGLMFIFGDRFGATALAMETDQFMWLLISAVIGIAIGHVFYYISIARLGVAVSAGVLQLQPFLVALASLYFFNELLTAGQWSGGVIAVLGALLMLAMQYLVSRRARSIEQPVAIAEGEGGS